MDGELVSVSKPKQLFDALKAVKKEVKNSQVLDTGIELVSCPEHLRPEIEQRISEVRHEVRKQIDHFFTMDEEDICLMA